MRTGRTASGVIRKSTLQRARELLHGRHTEHIRAVLPASHGGLGGADPLRQLLLGEPRVETGPDECHLERVDRSAVVAGGAERQLAPFPFGDVLTVLHGQISGRQGGRMMGLSLNR